MNSEDMMNAMRSFSLIIPIAVLILVAAGCNEAPEETKGETPYEAYSKLANAAAQADFGYMYDVLDSTSRGQVGMMIDLQLQQLDKLPESERVKWEQLKGLEGKEAFVKMVDLNRVMMTSRFRGAFEILDVDTIVVVKVKHVDQNPDVAYFKWEDGRYRFTPPPRPPSEPAALRVNPPAPPNAKADTTGN